MGKVDGESIIGGALALIASFAWRDAITDSIDTYYPVNVHDSKNLRVKFIFAIVITLFVFIAFYLYVQVVHVISEVSPAIDKFMDPNSIRAKIPDINTERLRGGGPMLGFSTFSSI